MAKQKKRKNQSLYDEVVNLERNLPIERQKLIEMDEAHAKAHKAQAAKISAMEQRLSIGRDSLLKDLFQQANVGEYGIRAVYDYFGKPAPEENTKPCDGPSQSLDDTQEKGDAG